MISSTSRNNHCRHIILVVTVIVTLMVGVTIILAVVIGVAVKPQFLVQSELWPHTGSHKSSCNLHSGYIFAAIRSSTQRNPSGKYVGISVLQRSARRGSFQRLSRKSRELGTGYLFLLVFCFAVTFKWKWHQVI